MTRRHANAYRSNQRGITLVELLTVVAIVGVMTTIAGVALDQDPTSEDVAKRISSHVNETARKAIAGGPTDTGGPRTRLRIYGIPGSAQNLLVERYRGPNPTDWDVLRTYPVTPSVHVIGYRTEAKLDPGSSPNYLLSAGEQVQLECLPNGSCLPDEAGSVGLTIYLRDEEYHDSRVVVLPLAGMPLTFDGW